MFRGTTAGNIGTTAIGNVAAGVLTYNDTTVSNDQAYFYVVKAVNAVGSSVASNTAQATPSAVGTPPGTPTGLNAEGNAGSISLNWTEPAGGNVDKYLLYRGTTAGGEDITPMATVIGATSYTDTNVTPGTPYFYKVRANNSYGESSLSNEATATASAITAPSAPQNLVATPGKGKVTLTWTAPSDDGGSVIQATRYSGPPRGNSSLMETVSATTLSYVDEGVTAGTNYTYTVKAVNAIGAGSASSPVTTSPQEDSGDGGSDNTMLYIGAAVVGVAAIGGIAYFLMRKKN